jgi:hypothetical protein
MKPHFGSFDHLFCQKIRNFAPAATKRRLPFSVKARAMQNCPSYFSLFRKVRVNFAIYKNF